jgi:type 1 fimbria pilin
MRKSSLTLGYTAAIALAFASTSAIAAHAEGKCKLTNVAVGKSIYDGACQIHQEETEYGTVISVKLANAEAFKFAGKGDTWMHGPEAVQFRDLGNGGAIFKWGDFALSAVAERR